VGCFFFFLCFCIVLLYEGWFVTGQEGRVRPFEGKKKKKKKEKRRNKGKKKKKKGKSQVERGERDSGKGTG